jgi:hypothetical protein
MNLEKLNVAELNSQEIKETEGGIIGVIVAGIVIGAAVEIMGDTDCFIDGLMGNP